MERAVPILPGSDLAVAKNFYVNELGFRVSFEATDDGRNGVLGLEFNFIPVPIDLVIEYKPSLLLIDHIDFSAYSFCGHVRIYFM